MQLHPLLDALSANTSFKRLLTALQGSARRANVLSAITPARAYALAALHAELHRPLLLVVGRPSDARQYVNELRAWTRNSDDILLFPETDALPYDRLPNDADKLSERLTTLE